MKIIRKIIIRNFSMIKIKIGKMLIWLHGFCFYASLLNVLLKVGSPAWSPIKTILLGIAFALTIQDAIGAGISILIAMIIKLIPQKLGDAVILSKAGLNHFWENVLSLLAVCSVYIGAIVGMALRSQLSSAQPYFFGALSGIFLYISLSSLFPVLRDIIDDNEIISKSQGRVFLE